MVRGLRKPGDLLARSDLCHLHDGREEAEASDAARDDAGEELAGRAAHGSPGDRRPPIRGNAGSRRSVHRSRAPCRPSSG